MYQSAKFSRSPLLRLILVAFATLTAHAADWTDWNTLRPGDTKAADGKLQILFTEKSGASSSAPLDVILATFDSGSFTFTDVSSIGPATDDQREQDIRLIGDKKSMWAVWRNKPSTGASFMQAAQVFPRPSEFSIETIDIGTSEARFDAAMGADNFPRVAFVTQGKKSLTVCRRTASGVWEKKVTLPIPGAENRSYEELAIATRGNSIALVPCSVTVLTPSIFGSELWSHWTPEPNQWTDLSFSNSRRLRERNEGSDIPSFRYPDAIWTEDENLVVGTVTGMQFSSSVTQSQTNAPVLSHQSMILGEFSTYVDPNVAVAPDGTIRFAICDTATFTNRAIYFPSTEDRFENETVSDQFAVSLDMELDALGNPWMITRHPNENLLQVSTLTDVTDLDGDGIPALIEQALFLNPDVPDAGQFPTLEFITVDGKSYPSFTIRSQSGGSGNNPYNSNDYSYLIEISDNLETWSSAPSDIVLGSRFTITGRGTVSTYRSTTPVNQGEFIRLRVTRRTP